MRTQRTREEIEEDYIKKSEETKTLEGMKSVNRIATFELLLDIRDLLQETQEEIKTIRRRI